MKILRLFSILKKHKYFTFYKNLIPCYDILDWNLPLKLVENPSRIWEPQVIKPSEELGFICTILILIKSHCKPL